MNFATKIIAALCSVALLQGCHHDDDDDNNNDLMLNYSLTTINLTGNQPLSPLAVALHQNQGLIEVGGVASDGLEWLAEAGDNTFLLAEFATNDDVNASAAGAGLIMPGASETLSISSSSSSNYLTLGTMLVNTNDAFAALNSISLKELAVGEALTVYARAYDSGTEANSESMATIPGPAAGGEGYSAARDDRDFIAVHPGVVTQADGLTGSVLTEDHRFDNPVAKVVVTRLP